MASPERHEEEKPQTFRFTGKIPDKNQPLMKKINLVKCLMNRELFASSSRQRFASLRPQTLKPLVPKSCFTIRLHELLPKSALLKGHIVLGLSRCGQFLLSYTCCSCEAPMVGFNYRYVLHWWVCIPHGKARRVAEVILFKDQGVEENLFLALCQWPHDNTKMVVYGFCDQQITPISQAQPFYVTVTMVPSLHGCKECSRVAATFEVEDLAANWDECVRLSCLRHSATVHTSCDIVAPFPRFEPEISLKLDNTVVINTGNFLHVLRVELESEDRPCPPSDQEDPLLPPSRPPEVEEEEFFRPAPLQISFLKSPQYFSNEEDDTRPKYADSESDDSIIDYPKQDNGRRNKVFFLDSEAESKPRNQKQLEEAEKVFEFIDERPDDIKLSTFRLRRLADKKYEFCPDEDVEAENIIPYRVVRQETPNKRHESSPQPTPAPGIIAGQQGTKRLPQTSNMQELSIYTSPPFSPSGDVLRPLNSNLPSGALQLGSPTTQPPQQNQANVAGPLGSPSAPQSVGSPAGSDCRSQHFHSDLASPEGRIKDNRPQQAVERKPVTYLVKLKRRFFDLDDEMVSVITDVEDDELGLMTGYHSALPLEVHGSGYSQMQMVSNAKAGKLNAACVLIQQSSFDIEQFCHEMAQLMCADAGMKYWFCSDYDVEIVDVCPNSGDVIVVAFVLMQATGRFKVAAKNQRLVQRKLYQAHFVFTWNLESGRYWIVRTSSLREHDVQRSTSPWMPARGECDALRRLAPPLPTHPPVRTLSNLPVLKGVSLTLLLDLENHMRIVLK